MTRTPLHIVMAYQYMGPEKYCPRSRPIYLAHEWVKQGHTVTIVVASYSHLFLSVPEMQGSHRVETENGIRYEILKTPRYAGNGIGRMINMAAFMVRLWQHGRRIAKELRPDIVISGSTHALDFLPVRRIARLSGGIAVREVRDLWPLTLTDLGGYGPRNPLVLLFKAVENIAYRTADRVVTTLPNSLEYMQERGLRPERWMCVPQGVDLEPQEHAELPEEVGNVLSRLRNEGRFLVGYAGSHGIANGLDVVVDAAQILRDTSAAFVLIGQGGEKERLKKRAADLGLTNMHFLPPIPKKCVQGFLAGVDVALIVWRKKPLYRYGVSPNKLMDYMLAAKPIIHAVEASNDMVAQADCGITVPPEDPPSLAHAVRQLMLVTPGALHAMGQRGAEFVRTHNDYRILAEQYLAFLKKS
ncbi:hypothetical protein ANRL2_04450 [Anaerolineae bacterium]|nr:hypothetical protein ANRL2_04450 [Anaerolineae bacterium]